MIQVALGYIVSEVSIVDMIVYKSEQVTIIY